MFNQNSKTVSRREIIRLCLKLHYSAAGCIGVGKYAIEKGDYYAYATYKSRFEFAQELISFPMFDGLELAEETRRETFPEYPFLPGLMSFDDDADDAVVFSDGELVVADDCDVPF